MTGSSPLSLCLAFYLLNSGSKRPPRLIGNFGSSPRSQRRVFQQLARSQHKPRGWFQRPEVHFHFSTDLGGTFGRVCCGLCGLGSVTPDYSLYESASGYQATSEANADIDPDLQLVP